MPPLGTVLCEVWLPPQGKSPPGSSPFSSSTRKTQAGTNLVEGREATEASVSLVSQQL